MEAIPWRVESFSQNVSKKMTCSIDSSMVVKVKYSDDAISAMITESREAHKHVKKLGRVMKTVATHRLKELRHL